MSPFSHHDPRDLRRDPAESGPPRVEDAAGPASPADNHTSPPAGAHDAEFDAPESETWGKLLRHVIDEMPAHVIAAFFFVGFLFFYGMANTLARAGWVAPLFEKLFARELAPLIPALSLATGVLGSVASTLWLLRIKYRKRR